VLFGAAASGGVVGDEDEEKTAVGAGEVHNIAKVLLIAKGDS